MGNPFTYPAWDLVSGAPLDPLPYKGVSFGKQVNQPGPWAGMLPLADPRVQKLAWNDASKTGKALLAVDLFGTLIWGGLVWTRKYRKSQKQLVVGATDVGSYFKARLQAADYSATFPENTAIEIVKKVVEDALTVANLEPGITFVVREVGVVPDVEAKYPGTSLQTLESIVNTLSQMGYGAGFDYSFDVAYVPGTTEPMITMTVWFPRQGRLANETGIVLLDGDMLDWEYPEDSTLQATEITVMGSGVGGTVPATASTVVPGYPLLQRTVSHAQILNQQVLDEIALGELGVAAHPVVTPWVELPLRFEGNDPLLPGEFTLGDDLIWRIDPVAGAGTNTSPRFPEGMEAEWRSNAWSLAVADAGVSTLHLDLGIPPVSTLPPPAPPI